jgi:hypothetical protein
MPPARRSAPTVRIRPRSRRWLAALLVVAGLVYVGIQLVIFDATVTLARTGQRTDAVVVGMENRSGGRRTYFHPVFEYRVTDGTTVRSTSASSVARSAAAAVADYPTGRVVPVLYDPADSSHVRPVSEVEAGRGVEAWFTDAFALLLFFGGAVLLLIPGRKRPDSAG